MPTEPPFLASTPRMLEPMFPRGRLAEVNERKPGEGPPSVSVHIPTTNSIDPIMWQLNTKAAPPRPHPGYVFHQANGPLEYTMKRVYEANTALDDGNILLADQAMGRPVTEEEIATRSVCPGIDKGRMAISNAGAAKRRPIAVETEQKAASNLGWVAPFPPAADNNPQAAVPNNGPPAPPPQPPAQGPGDGSHLLVPYDIDHVDDYLRSRLAGLDNGQQKEEKEREVKVPDNIPRLLQEKEKLHNLIELFQELESKVANERKMNEGGTMINRRYLQLEDELKQVAEVIAKKIVQNEKRKREGDEGGFFESLARRKKKNNKGSKRKRGEEPFTDLYWMSTRKKYSSPAEVREVEQRAVDEVKEAILEDPGILRPYLEQSPNYTVHDMDHLPRHMKHFTVVEPEEEEKRYERKMVDIPEKDLNSDEETALERLDEMTEFVQRKYAKWLKDKGYPATVDDAKKYYYAQISQIGLPEDVKQAAVKHAIRHWVKQGLITITGDPMGHNARKGFAKWREHTKSLKKERDLAKSVLNAKTDHEKLGIPVNATQAQIKKAYRNLAKRIHPDQNHSQNAEFAFKKLDDAYRNMLNGTSEKKSSSNPEKKSAPKSTSVDDDLKRAEAEVHKEYQQMMRRIKSELTQRMITRGVAGIPRKEVEELVAVSMKRLGYPGSEISRMMPDIINKTLFGFVAGLQQKNRFSAPPYNPFQSGKGLVNKRGRADPQMRDNKPLGRLLIDMKKLRKNILSVQYTSTKRAISGMPNIEISLPLKTVVLELLTTGHSYESVNLSPPDRRTFSKLVRRADLS